MRLFASKLAHLHSRIQCHFHHVFEGGLALFGGEVVLGAIDMVGNGADAQGPLASVGGVCVEPGGLHLHGQHAHALPLVVLPAALSGIEGVGGEDVAHLHVQPVFLGHPNGGGQQRVIGDGGEGSRLAQTEAFYIVGIGVCKKYFMLKVPNRKNF